MEYLLQQLKYVLALSLAIATASCSQDKKLDDINKLVISHQQEIDSLLSHHPFSTFVNDTSIIEDQIQFYNQILEQYSQLKTSQLNDENKILLGNQRSDIEHLKAKWNKYLTHYSSWSALPQFIDTNHSHENKEWAYLPAYFDTAKKTVARQAQANPMDYQHAIQSQLEVLRLIKAIQKDDSDPIWEQNRLAVKDYIAWCKSQEFEFYNKVIEEAGDRPR